MTLTLRDGEALIAGAASGIVRAIGRQQKRLLIGMDARAAVLLQGILPVRHSRIIRLRYGAYLSRP